MAPWADGGSVAIGDRCVEREFSGLSGQQYQEDDSRNGTGPKGWSLKGLVGYSEHRKRGQCERRDDGRRQRRRHEIRPKHVDGGRFHKVGIARSWTFSTRTQVP